MDVIHRLGQASAAEVRGEMDDAPSYSTVRTQLRILTDKGYLQYVADGPRYIYKPTQSAEEARKRALDRVLHTFFDGSAKRAVAALVDLSADELTDRDLDELEALIQQARRDGR